MIQNKSILDHKHKLEKIRLAKLKQQRKVTDMLKNIGATIVVVSVFGGIFWLITEGII